MTYRIMSCFLYDKDALDHVMTQIISYLNGTGIKEVIIQKSWVHGFHLKICYPKKIDMSGLETYVSNLVSENHTSLKEEDYHRLSKIILSVKEMEMYEGEVLPLNKEGEITFLESDVLPENNSLCADEVYEVVEKLKTNLLRTINEEWKRKSNEEQLHELAKMFYITSNLSPGGIRFGYLSLRSNFEYFKQQLKELGNRERAKYMENIITNRSKSDKEFVEKSVGEFLAKQYQNEVIFSALKVFIIKLQKLFTEAYQNDLLKIDGMFSAEDFTERHDQMSEFHQMFFSNQDFIKEYGTEGFIVYRYIASTLYSLMPLLKITPLLKQKVTGLVAESVESHFGVTWKDTYNLMLSKI
ncbi:hypothetical protein [Sediminibacillus sp. JSM 1682029]|uniref:hypothetical protein n=1 Tax=Sediminibacillus sp. JSM 1682029 TaxID=3229857 RepID=UPI0035248693